MATQEVFVLEWLLKIKDRCSKGLILITYSYNLLRKRNAERDAGKEISLWVKINIKNLNPLVDNNQVTDFSTSDIQNGNRFFKSYKNYSELLT